MTIPVTLHILHCQNISFYVQKQINTLYTGIQTLVTHGFTHTLLYYTLYCMLLSLTRTIVYVLQMFSLNSNTPLAQVQYVYSTLTLIRSLKATLTGFS